MSRKREESLFGVFKNLDELHLLSATSWEEEGKAKEKR